MANNRFEKQKLNRNDYLKEEKRIKGFKYLFTIAFVAIVAACTKVKSDANHDTPSADA